MMWSALESLLHVNLVSGYCFTSLLVRIQQDRCIHVQNMDCCLPQACPEEYLYYLLGELSCPFPNKSGFFSSIFESEEDEDRKEDEVILEQELAFSSPQPVCLICILNSTL